jgi:hypothetical protein
MSCGGVNTRTPVSYTKQVIQLSYASPYMLVIQVKSYRLVACDKSFTTHKSTSDMWTNATCSCNILYKANTSKPEETN